MGNIRVHLSDLDVVVSACYFHGMGDNDMGSVFPEERRISHGREWKSVFTSRNLHRHYNHNNGEKADAEHNSTSSEKALS
jgi:hypothetical protein